LRWSHFSKVSARLNLLQTITRELTLRMCYPSAAMSATFRNGIPIVVSLDSVWSTEISSAAASCAVTASATGATADVLPSAYSTRICDMTHSYV